MLLGHSTATRKLLAWTLTDRGRSNSVPQEFSDVLGFGFATNSPWLLTEDKVTNRCWSVQNGALQKEFDWPSPYRTSLGTTLAIATLNPDELILAQPKTSDSVRLLKLTPKAHRSKILAELRIPGGAKIKGLRISPNASILAALTEHEGNHAVQLWDLDRMNELLAGEHWAAPLFIRMRQPGESSEPVKARVDLARLERLDAVREQSEWLDALERDLRELSSGKSFDNPDFPTDEAPKTEQLLDRIAKTSGLLGAPEWERYFKERARKFQTDEKL
jgi:hypothetical protein